MNPTSLPALIDCYCIASGKTNAQIGAETGLRPNVIAMIRTGSMPLPWRRAVPLARAIGLNPLHVASRAMKPDDWQALVEIIPEAEVAAQAEAAC